jgi:hypothetical protein
MARRADPLVRAAHAAEVAVLTRIAASARMAA